jgi:hypothetical protein
MLLRDKLSIKQKVVMGAQPAMAIIVPGGTGQEKLHTGPPDARP